MKHLPPKRHDHHNSLQSSQPTVCSTTNRRACAIPPSPGRAGELVLRVAGRPPRQQWPPVGVDAAQQRVCHLLRLAAVHLLNSVSYEAVVPHLRRGRGERQVHGAGRAAAGKGEEARDTHVSHAPPSRMLRPVRATDCWSRCIPLHGAFRCSVCVSSPHAGSRASRTTRRARDCHRGRWRSQRGGESGGRGSDRQDKNKAQ